MGSKQKSIVLSLIQCGETAWDADGRLHGRTDLPLSTAGRAAVTEDAACLVGAVIATVHHSPDEAATETAQIVAKAVGAKEMPPWDAAPAHHGQFIGDTGKLREKN